MNQCLTLLKNGKIERGRWERMEVCKARQSRGECPIWRRKNKRTENVKTIQVDYSSSLESPFFLRLRRFLASAPALLLLDSAPNALLDAAGVTLAVEAPPVVATLVAGF
jgi:hypothetical protein